MVRHLPPRQETYGECPFLSGSMAHGFVSGLHGTDERYLRSTCGCKHFDVHAGPEDIPVDRSSFDAKVVRKLSFSLTRNAPSRITEYCQFFFRFKHHCITCFFDAWYDECCAVMHTHAKAMEINMSKSSTLYH